MARQPLKKRLDRIRDVHVLAILFAVSVLSRLPFLSTFELVAYDGTYYLNQAKTLFSGQMAGTFPIGYPAVVRLFAVLLRDFQVAGMMVSFVASVGAVYASYLILKRYVKPGLALLGSLVLTLNPLFMRMSLSTLSESLYIFLVLLGILLFLRERYVWFGLAMGAATVTRPEAIAIVGLLGLTLLRRPSRALTVAAGFLAIYAINAAVLSLNAGRLVVLPKSEYFGTSAQLWQYREDMIDFEGREQTESEYFESDPRQSVMASYLERMPSELGFLARHTAGIVLVLGLAAFRWRAYWFLAAGLVTFLLYPLVTVRSDPRYVLPYVPILVLAATLSAGKFPRRWRGLGLGLLVFAVILGLALNRMMLTVPDEPELAGLKKVATAFGKRVKPGDRIADRKPFFAYYAGGRYVEIPVAPYDDAMRALAERDVKYLVLHRKVIHALRPAFRPLLYSTSVVNGELRFKQVLLAPEADIIVFERDLPADPLEWSPIPPVGHMDEAPAWSRDGTKMAFRSVSESESGSIYIMESSGNEPPRRLIEVAPIGDQLAWSPDGTRIAYADDAGGTYAIFVADVDGGRITQLTNGPGNDVSPCWTPDGDTIVFSSDRDGGHDIFLLAVDGGDVARLTRGANASRPAVSPDGALLAWIEEGRGVVVYERANGYTRTLATPSQVAYAPAFSPDGRHLVVTASNWGSWDLYMCRSDGSNALLLTKNYKRESMPAWSPDGSKIALVSEHESGLHLWTISGLDPYLQRLDNVTRWDVFPPPPPR